MSFGSFPAFRLIRTFHGNLLKSSHIRKMIIQTERDIVKINLVYT